MRAATVIKIVVVLAAALVATAVAVLMSTDFGAYKGQIESAVRDATGRRLSIDGTFSLRLGLAPAVTVENVRFANASWGSRPDMAKIEKIDAEVRLLPLVFGEVRIKRLVISGADIILETDKQGNGNWLFVADVPIPTTAPQPAPQPEPAPQPADTAGRAPPALTSFDRVHVERARLVWRDGMTGKRDEVTINSFDAQADSANAPVRIALHALYTGSPVGLGGTLGSLAGLARPSTPWPFDLTADAGGAAVQAKGTIREPLRGRGIDVTLAVRGDDLSRLGALVGTAVPAIGPYRLDARVDEEGATWTAHHLAVSLGKSSLAGEVAVDTGANPPKLRATLAAPLLDVADFAGKPAARPAPAGSAPPKPDDGRLFDDTPLPVEALKGIDAEIALSANRLVAGGVPFVDAAVTLRIDGGMLTANPVKATVAGAPVTATLSIGPAAGRSAPSVALKLDAAKIDLATVLKEAGKPKLATGKIDLSADVTGSGKSLRALMAGLSGNVGIVMGRGTITDDTLDLLSADVLRAISPWAPRRRDLQVRCVVGRYDIRNGMMTSRVTVFDSDRVALSGDGGVNLATEQIGFTVVPHAKDVSLLQLAVPIRIGGTLAAPVAYPDAGRMATGAFGTVTGLPGTVAGAIGNLLGGSTGAAENPCLAALGEASKSGPSKSESPAEGIGRTLEGIGKGIGSGLRNLFGQ